MLMDISSEMIHALLPVYMVTVLGTSMATVGFIEGLAEATASITKIFSGALSDWLGKRKLLAVLGYGLAACTKPVFPLAQTVDWLIAARFVDRIGKGIRGAPRDALIAEIAPVHLRGASFGLRQSLDTIGAFIGPLFGVALMWWTANDFQSVFWIAVVPAFMATGLIVFAVREPQRPSGFPHVKSPLSPAAMKRLGSAYWRVVLVAMAFNLARFSEAFLILRAHDVGVPTMWVPTVLVAMNIVYALSAYPAGVMSDRFDRKKMLAIGLVVLGCADVALALMPNIAGIALGLVLWGLHMGLTQGLFATLVANASPPELRGTAFGYFNLLTGLSMLVASLVAGWMWDLYGPGATFGAGGFCAFLALGGLIAVRGSLGDKDAELSISTDP
ncbi:MAG: MFS transporter [Bradyrhizobiaceae bacterium]|nr:MAG: MFS transporter [Bradyrhizobiaceae bacterium]